MHINELRQSSYLQKTDVGAGTIGTIRGLRPEDVGTEEEPETKYVLYFAEFQKGLVLNTTNASLIAQALGTEETDEWIGQQITLYNDPSVMFKGRLTGGIRVRPVGMAQPQNFGPRAHQGGGGVDFRAAVKNPPPQNLPPMGQQAARKPPVPMDDDEDPFKGV